MIIGYSISGMANSALLDTTNFDEFDIVVLETSAFVHAIPKRQQTFVPVAYSEGVKFTRSLQVKIAELEAWVSSGHTLIVVLDEPLVVFEYGHQSNPMTPIPYDFASLSLFSRPQLGRKTGTRVKLADENSKCLLNDWINKVQYHYLIGSKDRHDVLVVDTALAGDVQAVASIIYSGKGQVIFVPTIVDRKLRDAYIKALVEIRDRLKATAVPLPKWADDFGPEDEKAIRTDIGTKNNQISQLQALIAERNDALESFRWFKTLVSGSGDDFMNVVRKAMEIVGFDVVPVVGNRTDLIARDGDRILACETKGVERPGKEEDLRQTRTWVSEVDLAIVTAAEGVSSDPHLKQCAVALAELDITTGEEAGKRFAVTGLLVLATFRNLPLDQRTSPDFSNDMLLNAKRSSVCILTGHQLVNLVLLCERSPERKAAIREKLSSTAGAFQMDDMPDLFKRL